MTRLTKHWFYCAVLLLPTPALAQEADGFDLSGTIRVRYEAIENQPRVGFNRDDDLVNLRTTLMAKYRTGPVQLIAELWDSRVYGGDAGTPITTGEVNTLELAQAYVAADIGLGTTKAKVSAGRFTLNIGSRRLVAADDYRNTVSSYTGLRGDLAFKGGLSATLIYVLPQQRRPDDTASLQRNAVAFDHEGFDQVLWGGTVAQARAIGPMAVEGTFYHLGEHDTPGRPTRDRSLDTYGGRMFSDRRSGKFDVELEGVYQSGLISASTAAGAAKLPVAAWFAHASTGYTFAVPWPLRLSVEYDRASGDHTGGSYGRFDTLYGMRRPDLAPAGLYNAIGRANISTPGLRLELTPSKRIDLMATYHAFWLADRTDSFSTTGVRDPSGRSGAFAGHQIDTRVRWWVSAAKLRLEADVIVLTKGAFMRDAPNAPAGGTTLYSSFNLTAMF